MNSNNFFSLVPDFINGVHAMRRELIGAALVIAFAGLIIHVCAALVRKDIGHMVPTLVRLALIPIIIGSLESWGDLLFFNDTGTTQIYTLPLHVALPSARIR